MLRLVPTVLCEALIADSSTIAWPMYVMMRVMAMVMVVVIMIVGVV